MSANPLSRRDFLKDTGILFVSVSLAGAAPNAFGQAASQADGEVDPASLDTWVAVAEDETVTAFTSKIEYGQGIQTALGQIVAEELDIPFARLKMDLGDTAKTVDQFLTAGSRTISGAGPQLRQAAAAARQELLKLASTRLDTPVSQLVVNAGVVSSLTDPSKKVSYGKLVGGKRFDVRIKASGTGMAMVLAPDVRAKDPKDYKIVGTSVPRVDLPEKFAAKYTFCQDVRVPGMLHGRMVRPQAVLSQPIEVDESSIKHIAGVVKVVREGSLVGIVAETEWAAIQAAGALKVTWSTPSTKMPADQDELYAYLKNTKKIDFGGMSLFGAAPDTGDVTAGLSRAAKTYEATYYWPFQGHTMLAPSCSVADVQGDKVTVWSGSQGPFETRGMVAKTLGIPEMNVHFLYRGESGSYGRLEVDDCAVDAALLSRAVGKPVRVQWMREEENHWEAKGPAQLTTIRAGVDANGKLIAWDFLDRSFPWTENSPNPWLGPKQVGLKPSSPGMGGMGAEGGGSIYEIENRKVSCEALPWIFAEPTPLRVQNLRAPLQIGTSFASESLIDEIAADLKIDPVQFRLPYLNKRRSEVLLAAAEKAGWEKRAKSLSVSANAKATGWGVALSDRGGTIVALVACVEVDKSSGKIKVKKLTAAQDCGRIVNPDGVSHQIEGNLIHGLSRTLFEEVDFDALKVKSVDWLSYPVITFADVPETEVVLLNRPELDSTGSGEPSICPVPAAVANAVFDAVGVRMRHIPLKPQRVLDALKAKA
jgi:CO/xanthine dehydrogenase Mo-binding subunit